MTLHEAMRFFIHMDLTCLEPIMWKWTVTCERCNADLSDDFTDQPITIINFKGDIPPRQMQMMREALGREWDLARSTARLLVFNTEMDVKEIPSANLQLMLQAHAKKCPHGNHELECKHEHLGELLGDGTVPCTDCKKVLKVTCRRPECKLSMIHAGACVHDGSTW